MANNSKSASSDNETINPTGLHLDVPVHQPYVLHVGEHEVRIFPQDGEAPIVLVNNVQVHPVALPMVPKDTSGPMVLQPGMSFSALPPPSVAPTPGS